VKLQENSQYLDSKFKTHVNNYDSPSKVTLKDVLHKPNTTPTTPAVLKIAHNFVQSLIQEGEGSSAGVITL